MLFVRQIPDVSVPAGRDAYNQPGKPLEGQCVESSRVTMGRELLGSTELPLYQGVALTDVCLVDSAALAHEALDALMAAGEIGFDTESKPTFRIGELSTGPHLIQLACETRVYLFQIPQSGSLRELKEILGSPQLLKVGFGLGNDLTALRSKLGIETAGVLDLGAVLRVPGHRGTVGAKVAVAHFFGQQLQKSKKTSTSNWATAQLSERQILYAANDAQVALRIYRAWKRTDSLAFAE